MIGIAERIKDETSARPSLYWVGQAGFVIRSAKGTLLAIDLYLSDCVQRVEGHIGFKRLVPALFSPEELVFDYLIATHPHCDHFDEDAMPRLMNNGHTKLFTSVNCEHSVGLLGIDAHRVCYVRPGDHYTVDDIEIDFVLCDHGSAAPDAVGVVIRVDGKVLYFAGDTCLRLDWTAWLSKQGPFDLLVAPINGAYGNLNEQECARLSAVLKPVMTIPCHYGMFASHGGDPGRFMSAMKMEAPEQKYTIMTYGEQLFF